jgi:hypothetical protein
MKYFSVNIYSFEKVSEIKHLGTLINIRNNLTNLTLDKKGKQAKIITG